MRESAKASEVWDNAPLVKNITSTQTKKFFDTVGTITIVYTLMLLILLSLFIYRLIVYVHSFRAVDNCSSPG